jgi:hypothetical protein
MRCVLEDERMVQNILSDAAYVPPRDAATQHQHVLYMKLRSASAGAQRLLMVVYRGHAMCIICAPPTNMSIR